MLKIDCKELVSLLLPVPGDADLSFRFSVFKDLLERLVSESISAYRYFPDFPAITYRVGYIFHNVRITQRYGTYSLDIFDNRLYGIFTYLGSKPIVGFKEWVSANNIGIVKDSATNNSGVTISGKF